MIIDHGEEAGSSQRPGLSSLELSQGEGWGGDWKVDIYIIIIIIITEKPHSNLSGGR
jgi:hypothetical protein